METTAKAWRDDDSAPAGPGEGDPDLQASLRHLRRIAAGALICLAVLGVAAGLRGPAAAPEAGAGQVATSLQSVDAARLL